MINFVIFYIKNSNFTLKWIFFFKNIIFTGNPVRGEFEEIGRVNYIKSISNKPFTILIYGGSLGASYFSNQLTSIICQLPEKIRTSSVLTGNELAILASYEDIPKKDPDFFCNQTLLQMHEKAKKLINMSQVDLAWQYLIHD